MHISTQREPLCKTDVTSASLLIITCYTLHTPIHTLTVTPTLYRWKLDLKIISNADRHLWSVGFPVVSILPTTVYPKPNVNASGILSFTGLCWSHTAFPCIIYIKLSPLLCIHKHRVTNKQGSMNDRNQIFMPEPEHLRRVTWPWGSAEATSFCMPSRGK